MRFSWAVVGDCCRGMSANCTTGPKFSSVSSGCLHNALLYHMLMQLPFPRYLTKLLLGFIPTHTGSAIARFATFRPTFTGYKLPEEFYWLAV